jgi:hypothetical protein
LEKIMPQQRTSKTTHEYAGRVLSKGDMFECEQQDIPLLLAIGRIEPEEGEKGYQTRDMRAGKPGRYKTKASA